MLDEPTANIDPASIMLLEERIQEYYQQEKPTILMVTHNIQQTRRLCNRVAFMNEGEVLDSGDLRHLYGAEAHPLVRAFIQKWTYLTMRAYTNKAQRLFAVLHQIFFESYLQWRQSTVFMMHQIEISGQHHIRNRQRL